MIAESDLLNKSILFFFEDQGLVGGEVVPCLPIQAFHSETLPCLIITLEPTFTLYHRDFGAIHWRIQGILRNYNRHHQLMSVHLAAVLHNQTHHKASGWCTVSWTGSQTSQIYHHPQDQVRKVFDLMKIVSSFSVSKYQTALPQSPPTHSSV